LVLVVALILVYNALVITWESSTPDPLSVAYASLGAFVGSYTPLYGQPGQPTPLMSIGLISALLATFGAAGTALLKVSRASLAQLAWTRVRDGIVIIGSSAEADVIARSVDPAKREKVIRLKEEDLVEVLGSRATRKALGGANHIVVAASSDAESTRIAENLSEAAGETFRLVRSTVLANALRPNVLTALTNSEAFHPADNVGQVVARVIAGFDAHERVHGGDIAQRSSLRRLRVAVHDFGRSSSAPTIESWLRHASDAVRFTGGATLDVVEPESDADVRVFAGDYEEVAAAAALRSGNDARHYVIAVVPVDLQRVVAMAEGVSVHTRSDWEQRKVLLEGDILVIDPEVDGLDFSVIVDGISAQWGRAYDDAYTRLYASKAIKSQPTDSSTVTRNQQSSIAAARHMLGALEAHGYVLRKGRTGWAEGIPAAETIESLARAEHDDWWNRTWIDESGTPQRVAIGSENARPFDELDARTKEYNRDIVRKVYPALAAMFGYGITRS